MSCAEAMDLVSQIEDEMSPLHVVQRKLAREALFIVLPMIPDVPGFDASQHAGDTQYYVDAIRPRAQKLADGDADAVTDTKNVLRGCKEKLFEDEPVGFGAASGHMQHWRGASADAFKGYLNRTDKDYRLVQDALSDFATLYDMYGQVISACHADLVSILNAGLSAFQNVDQQALTVTLTTASAVLAPLTAGDSLILVSVVGGTAALSGLVSTVSVWTSSDLDTAKTIVQALDSLKDNTISHLKQINGTLADLADKIRSATKDVQDNLPDFAKPGQTFDSTTFQPDAPPSDPKPISTAPLIPKPADQQSSADITRRLNPV